MPSAAALLDQLGRPGDLRLGTAHPTPRRRLATGIPPLDGALDGGLPRGTITEVWGARSVGRTALACRIAAGATTAGETAAWIDPADALDADATTTAGIHLDRLLWVRPRTADDALRAADILLGAGGFGLVVLDLAGAPPPTKNTAPWSRLTRAAERTSAVLLVLGTARQAGATAALGLELGSRRARWLGTPGSVVLLDGLVARVTVARSRGGGMGRALAVQACA